MRSQGCTYNPTGLPVHSQGCARTQSPNQDAPQNLESFSPSVPGSMFLYYISYNRHHGSACVLARCGVPSSRILVTFWPTCVVLSCYVSSPVSAGPCGLSSPRISMALGGMKTAFLPSPSPENWRVRRLDSTDVDSLVWLASTLTYIICAARVPFMVWMHSRLWG